MDLKELNDKHGHNQIKICVSGAAETGACGIGALDLAKELGREIARQGAVLVTGATTGFPFWTAVLFAICSGDRGIPFLFEPPIRWRSLIISSLPI